MQRILLYLDDVIRAFEKIRGLVIWTGILVAGWRLSVRERRVTKENNVKILFNNYVHT